jgi:hypothetical protein
MVYTYNMITSEDYEIIYNLYQAAIEKRKDDYVINILIEMSKS